MESRALSYERERVREEKKGKRMHEQVEIAIVSRADFFAVNDDHRVTGSSISWKRETLSRDRSNSLSPIPCFSKFLPPFFVFILRSFAIGTEWNCESVCVSFCRHDNDPKTFDIFLNSIFFSLSKFSFLIFQTSRLDHFFNPIDSIIIKKN